MRSSHATVTLFGSTLLVLLSLGLAACGGGGGGGNPPPSPPLSANANLSTLGLGSVALEPGFRADRLSYTALVGYLTDSVQITAAREEAGASIAVNGVALASGQPVSVPLAEQANTLTIRVTAANGTVRDYSIEVWRQPAVFFAQDAYLKASNADQDDRFGNSVALDGNTLAIGAPSEDSAAIGVNGAQQGNAAPQAGAVYVFVRDSAGAWSQQAYLKASNSEADDVFGTSLALRGDTLVVGAPNEDSNATGVNGNGADNSAVESGAAYVFTRDAAGQWTQQAYLKASNTGDVDRFGNSVAVDGNLIAVAAALEDGGGDGPNSASDESALSAGAVYVFERGTAGWTQHAYIKASNSDAEDMFGTSLALAGNTLVVGAWGEDGGGPSVGSDPTDNTLYAAGAAYVFTRDGAGAWTQRAYLKASNSGMNDLFGGALAFDGETLAVGAVFESSNATGVDGNQSDDSAVISGAVYVFARNAAGSWTQQAYLKASNTEQGDSFGQSIALEGNNLAVGAPAERSAARGNGGDQTSNAMAGSGAVYVFARNASNAWQQRAYLKASNTDSSDNFGTTLALDGNLLVVGASREDGGSSGVNGSQQRNTQFLSSGASYVFGGIPNTDAVVSELGLDLVELDQTFQANQPVYSATVGFLGTAVDVSATMTGGKLVVNGVTMDDTRPFPVPIAVALAEGASPISVEAKAEDGRTFRTYTINVTRQPASSLAQRVYLKASNTETADLFGQSVALDGSTMVVGAPNEDSASTGVNGDQTSNGAFQSGAVYVFVRDKSGAWTQQAYIKAPEVTAADRFGTSVAIHGDTLVVGAPHEDGPGESSNGAGAAYVYRRAAGAWQFERYITAPNAGSSDRFGEVVAVHGDVLLVTALREESAATGINGDMLNNTAPFAGAVYAFRRIPSGSWIAEAYIKASNAEASDEFGIALAFDGTTLAVGAHRERGTSSGIGGDQNSNGADYAGAAYVFVRSGDGSWSQQAYIKATNAEAFDQFGASVALRDGLLVVGAPGEHGSVGGVNGNQSDNGAPWSGAAYVYARDAAGTWTPLAYLKAPAPLANDRFATSVAVHGGIVAVGQPYNGFMFHPGTVSLFSVQNGMANYIASPAPLVEDDTGRFGTALGLDTTGLAVTAMWEESAATGINGNANDNSMPSSGAAYFVD